MKRRRDAFTRIVAALLVLAVAAFAAVNLYNRVAHPLTTARAAAMTVRRELTATGYIVREEKAMPGLAELSAPEMKNGEKAYSGALIATVYPSGADEATLSSIREYKQRISALKDSVSRGSDRARQCEAAVRELVSAIAGRDLVRAGELSVAAESMLLADAENVSPEAEIARLESEVASLTALLRGGTGVYAPKAGVVSQYADGFENVTPSLLAQATPSGLRGWFTAADSAGSCAMVYGIKWYLAVILPSSDAGLMRERSTVRVLAPRLSGGEYVMSVERIGNPESGECVVTLSCDARIAETFGQRLVTAHLLFGEDAGFAVPKQAVRLDDAGQTHVYAAVSRSAVRLDVDILRELGGDTYLVAIKTDYGISDSDAPDVKSAKTRAQNRNAERSAYLRDGAEIVLRATDLSDGKVLR